MREFYQIVFLMTLFIYCINVFAVFLGEALSIPQLSALAIPDDVTEQEITDSYQTLNSTAQGGFDTSLVFGDWIKPINTFIAIISLQGVINMIGNFGMPESFITPLSYIFALFGIGALIYLISGRS